MTGRVNGLLGNVVRNALPEPIRSGRPVREFFVSTAGGSRYDGHDAV